MPEFPDGPIVGSHTYNFVSLLDELPEEVSLEISRYLNENDLVELGSAARTDENVKLVRIIWTASEILKASNRTYDLRPNSLHPFATDKGVKWRQSASVICNTTQNDDGEAQRKEGEETWKKVLVETSKSDRVYLRNEWPQGQDIPEGTTLHLDAALKILKTFGGQELVISSNFPAWRMDRGGFYSYAYTKAVADLDDAGALIPTCKNRSDITVISMVEKYCADEFLNRTQDECTDALEVFAAEDGPSTLVTYHSPESRAELGLSTWHAARALISTGRMNTDQSIVLALNMSDYKASAADAIQTSPALKNESLIVSWLRKRIENYLEYDDMLDESTMGRLQIKIFNSNHSDAPYGKALSMHKRAKNLRLRGAVDDGTTASDTTIPEPIAAD